jgi:hypothetical protein
MDEIFGYMPPVANPSSKQPLLTLLKQARAFGVGIVLATQNPVDLDYKGLSNAGTWFIGRLQTERDKERLLEGLEGASASLSAKFDRQDMEEILAGLGNRIFLMNNVHDDAPVVFQTRWTMSYLRGPITRNQIKTLMGERKIATHVSEPDEKHYPKASVEVEKVVTVTDASVKERQRPFLPPGVSEYFIPVRGSQPAGTELVYQPVVLGAGQVHFSDVKTEVDVTVDKVFITPITSDAVPVQWDNLKDADVVVSDLENTPLENAKYLELPAPAGNPKNYETWRKDFASRLYRNEKIELLISPGLKEVSKPDEPERDFRIRLQDIARQKRDELKEKLRQKYAPKIAALEERLRKAEQAVARESEQAKQQKIQTAISFGAVLLGSFLGRKKVSASSVGRATTAMRGMSRTMKESQDVGRAEESADVIKKRLADMDAGFQSELEALETKVDPLTETLETITVRPAKSDITVQLTALAWLPNWQGIDGKMTQAL